MGTPMSRVGVVWKPSDPDRKTLHCSLIRHAIRNCLHEIRQRKHHHPLPQGFPPYLGLVSVNRASGTARSSAHGIEGLPRSASKYCLDGWNNRCHKWACSCHRQSSASQPSPHDLAFPWLAAVALVVIALALSMPAVWKKKFLAVQALASALRLLHRFQNEMETVSETGAKKGKKSNRKRSHPAPSQRITVLGSTRKRR